MASNGVGIDLTVGLGLEQRAILWRRIEGRVQAAGNGCLEWTGYRRNQYGHGALSIHNRPVYVHQLSYAIWVGPIPKGRTVCHRCDNPKCVRREHLFLATQVENIADMRAKGRGKRPPIIQGERHHKAHLTNKQVDEIRALGGSGRYTQRQLARQFGTTQSAIWRYLHRQGRA